MNRDEALAIVNGSTIQLYADNGECPLCHRQSPGPDHYPHDEDCPFVVATKIVEGGQ